MEDPTTAAGLDPDTPRITTDILPPRAATQSPAGRTKSTKYSTDAERRKAISEVFKRRRASSANKQSHGQNKRVQTATANFQSSLRSFFLQSGLSAQHQSRPSEPASTSSTSTSTSAPTSDSSDVDMMDQVAPVLADDSNDGDWEEGSQGSDASVDNLLASQLQTEATGETTTAPLRAITRTPSGRPYLRWNGEAVYGTLIPDGYELSTAISGFLWICPIRSCRKVFPGIKQLGGHFARQHRGCLLHDNMDGTLSVRGTYAKLRNGEGAASTGTPKPGIVVSVGPLDPTEPPMVAPSLPEQGRHHVDTNQVQSRAGSDHSAVRSPALSLAKASSFMPSVDNGFELAEPGRRYTEWPDKDGLFRSLYGVLIPAGYTMCLEPRKKPLPCPVRHCQMRCLRFKDLGFHFARAHYASYLKDRGDGSFEVIGKYATKRGNIVRSGKIINPRPPIVVAQMRPDGSTEWVSNWERMKRVPVEDDAAATLPDTASDVLMCDEVPVDSGSNSAPDMTPMSEQVPVSTVRNLTPNVPQDSSGLPDRASNCPPKSTWEHMETVDKERLRWKYQKSVLPPDNRHHPPQDTMMNLKRAVIIADVVDLEKKEERPSIRYQMRTRTTATDFVNAEPPPQPGQEAVEAESVEAQFDEERLAPEQPPQLESVQELKRIAKEQRQPPRNLISNGEVSNDMMVSGLVIAESVLEMEEWEVAPGRIREQNPGSESIAFSKSYLSSAHAVDVCEDVAFRVETIKSGHTFKIEADPNQLRLCSLASGKLRVKIGDEPWFVIGPHGMFKVKAGVSCIVSNRMYIDAVMHTTALNGFF